MLGHVWNIVKSPMKQSVSVKTKRTVLQTVASVYDPLGLFSPVVLRGKQLIQNLWGKKLIGIKQWWNWWTRMVKNNKGFITNKKSGNQKMCYHYKKRKGEITTNLVCFCDASEKAYACCIYLQQRSQNMNKVELIFSKSR